MTAVPTYPNKKNRISDCHLFSPFQCGLAARNWRFCLISSVGAKDYDSVPSDAHAGSRRKRLFAAYIRSACPGRQAQRKMDARCALILGLAERVYHSQQLLSLHGLYSLYFLLSPLWLLCGSSGLLCKLAHPFKLRPPAGRALPVPPCERIFSTIYFGIVAWHDTVVLRSFPRISPKISLSRAHKFILIKQIIKKLK